MGKNFLVVTFLLVATTLAQASMSALVAQRTDKIRLIDMTETITLLVNKNHPLGQTQPGQERTMACDPIEVRLLNSSGYVERENFKKKIPAYLTETAVYLATQYCYFGATEEGTDRELSFAETYTINRKNKVALLVDPDNKDTTGYYNGQTPLLKLDPAQDSLAAETIQKSDVTATFNAAFGIKY